MNGDVTRWNDMTRNLVTSNRSDLRLMDLENTLRMIDHLALTRDEIHFNAAQGRRWTNDVFQTKNEEMEQELRTIDSLARNSSNRGSRLRGNVLQPLASHHGPPAMKTGATAPVAPSSDVSEGLGTTPPPKRQPLKSRLGRSIDQSQTSSRTVSRTSNPPATVPAPAGSPSASATPAEGIGPNSELLWNRPDTSGWGQYKTDVLANEKMNILTCRTDAKMMMGGEGPTVSGLYRISGVDWLLTEWNGYYLRIKAWNL